jgi:hypothetical protein
MNEAARFDAMAEQALTELDEYTADYPSMRREIRKCNRILQLMKWHPDADYKVLEYRAEREID